MTSLLCRVGIHRPDYRPAIGQPDWLQVSVCASCPTPVERPVR